MRTFPPSLHLVSMTIVSSLCSQIILQKSTTVFVNGPERREGERGKLKYYYYYYYCCCTCTCNHVCM